MTSDVRLAAEKALRAMELDEKRGNVCWYCTHEDSLLYPGHTETCVIHELRAATSTTNDPRREALERLTEQVRQLLEDGPPMNWSRIEDAYQDARDALGVAVS